MQNQPDILDWIGKTETASDEITPELLRRFDASLSGFVPLPDGVRHGLHWCFYFPAFPADQLGADSHPAKGGFLPPVDLPRRMWAGGDIEVLGALPLSGPINRSSKILDIQSKTGRSGALAFVTLEHVFASSDGIFLKERQDVVYKEEQPFRPAPATEMPDAAHAHSCAPDTTLLFRYSAMTFNGHRIHYDYPYATQVEGYPNLVTHGPLLATFLMNWAQMLRPDTQLKRFTFRAVSPIFVDDSVHLLALDETCEMLEVRNKDGALAMQATATFA